MSENNVSVLVHYPIPVHLQEAYKFLGLGRGSLPNTEKIADEIVSLPLYPELGNEEIKKIAELINEF